MNKDLETLREFVEDATRWKDGSKALMALKNIERNTAALDVAELLIRSHKDVVGHLRNLLDEKKTDHERAAAEEQARLFLTMFCE